MELRQPVELTDHLITHSQPAMPDNVMVVLYEINSRWEKVVLRVASVPAASGASRAHESSLYDIRRSEISCGR